MSKRYLNARVGRLMPLLALPVAFTSCADTDSNANAPRPKQNVLFIIIDDLRPELGCYGSDVLSPNIDALARSGVRFDNAYCNIPVSGASRASLLTGTRPTRYTFLDARATADFGKPDVTGINNHFQEAGYSTIVAGKVFHWALDHNAGWDKRVEVNSTHNHYALPENVKMVDKDGKGPAFECADVADEEYFDGQVAQNTIEELKRLAKSGEQFFLAYGQFRPHLPFNSPKKYWDMYDHESITIPENFHMKRGDNKIPAQMFHSSGELFSYVIDKVGGNVTEEDARNLIHGYKAAVSYTDAQVGKVLDALEELGLADNTAVVLLGDHGWNLGDHGLWCKHTIFDHAAHTPVIIRDPASKLKGYTSNEVIEYVDIFPTLCDLAGVASHEQAEGLSLLPLLNDKQAKHKGFAISRWGQGYRIINQEGFAYAEWWDKEDKVLARTLFNHNTDPRENQNVVDDPKYADLVAEMSAKLMANRGANFDKYPKTPANNDPYNIKK